ncbi:hypothetical protein M3484_04645, partial [Pseudomonas sp. GX19020]|uniref:hypothetical protein n=1 Tax=Pseudomonas sp. GX19020 TaxID=2942277 RepID=UPI002018C627
AADFAPVLGATATAIDSNPGRLVLAGVEHEAHGVIQALILSPVTVGAQAIDPAFMIGKSPEEARAAFELEAANLAAGLPLYSAAILAEVATVQGPQVVISLAYPHCDDATAAVSRAPALWDLMNPSYMPAPAEISGEVVEAAPGCAARITITATGEGDAGNLAVLRSVVTGIQFRDVAILRIGAEPAGVSPE